MLSRFKQQLHPARPVFEKLQEKLPLMASVGQIPDMSGKQMLIGS